MKLDKATILKYDVSGPRYTSYPTAPMWTEQSSPIDYKNHLQQFDQNNKTLSLYFHLPFCQSMCTFCACNVIIRPQEDRYGDQYLTYLFKEIDLVSAQFTKKPVVKQLHFGGGTPTYFSEDQLSQLMDKIHRHFNIDAEAEVAIEIDPRTIDLSKIKKLKELGFNRISMGVQDFDNIVQQEINRIQSFEDVKKYTDYCRELGFHSLNYDLIYGLPKQTTDSFNKTMELILGLRPDRIALYSFAFVPWLKKHQNKIDQDDLPSADHKLDIFLHARDQFIANDYEAIAMDHFALKTDELAQAFFENRLYRNFMGYTVKPADEYIGMGLTAIGFIEGMYTHNHKILKDYFAALDNNELPIDRGLVLSEDDHIRQWTINSFMCHFHCSKTKFKQRFNKNFDQYFTNEANHLQQCEQNGFIYFDGDTIRITDLGKIFIRNICMGFDQYLNNPAKPEKRYSRTV